MMPRMYDVRVIADLHHIATGFDERCGRTIQVEATSEKIALFVGGGEILMGWYQDHTVTMVSVEVERRTR